MQRILLLGGPPLVLWSMAQPWESKKIRAFLFGVFSCSIPIQVIILGFTFGFEILHYSGLGFLLFPFVWAGAKIGLPLGNRMEKKRLRLAAYGILLLVGASVLIPAVMHF